LGILRTILAIAVVAYHSFSIFGVQFCGGQIAVETFYIISGFYMALILNEKYVGKGSYKKFLLSRFYRIYPAYWIVLVLALTLSVCGYLYNGYAYNLTRYISYKECLSLPTIMYFVWENLVIVGQDVMYFLRLDDTCQLNFTKSVLSYKHNAYQYLLVPQAWSISIELFFYILAPFIVTKKIKWQLVFIALSLGLKIICYNFYYLYYDPWTYRFFPFELAYFLFGSIAYQLYLHFKTEPQKPIVGYVLLVVCLLGVLFIRDLPIENNIKIPCFYALIVISIPFIFNVFKNSKWDLKIGELSFPLYIIHLLVVSFFHNYFFSHFQYLNYYGLVVLTTSLILALLLNYFVFQKIEKYRAKRFS
jgi:peptidoglycan/LPS O-acetylase OafA/YrhL